MLFRILIAEDIEDTRILFAEVLEDAFPDAVLISHASTVKEGLDLIDRASTEHCEFDVAILDFRLPFDMGSKDEIDDLLCHALREKRARTHVVHVTAFPTDPLVLKHLQEYHGGLTLGRWNCISKLETDWPAQLVDTLKTVLYGGRIQEQFDAFFAEGREAGTSRNRAARTEQVRGDRSHTHALARLSRDIVEFWSFLPELLKKRICRVFTVDESQEPVRITLKKGNEL